MQRLIDPFDLSHPQMEVGKTQTPVVAWPSSRRPGWLAEIAPVLLGGVLALVCALVFQVSVDFGSTWWTYVSLLGLGSFVSSVCGLCGPSISQRARALCSAYKRHPSTLFTLATPWFTIMAAATTICVSAEIGLGWMFAAFCIGLPIGGFLVDRWGVGWNRSRRDPYWKILMTFLCVAGGAILFAWRQIKNSRECVADNEGEIAIAVTLAILSGLGQAYQNAGLAELSYFLGQPFRGVSVALGIASLLLTPMAWWYDGPPPPISPNLLTYPTICCSIGSALLMSFVGSTVAKVAPLGALVCVTGGLAGFASVWTGLAATGAVASVNAAKPGWTTGLGLSLLIGAAIAARVRRSAPPITMYEQEGDVCAVCVANDEELLVATEEYQAYPLAEEEEGLAEIVSAPKPEC